MKCIADFEITSELAVVGDGIQLRLEHPRGRFEALIKNIEWTDYTSPFLLSLQIIFESPDLQAAKDLATDYLRELLNIFSLATGSRFTRHKTKQIIDSTPDLAMRDCLIYAHDKNEDPQPFIEGKIVDSIARLLDFDAPRAIQRSLRWYRIGINATIPEDQYHYFWFALEILAEYMKPAGKVANTCPQCKAPLYCEVCKTHPTHQPFAIQAIRQLIAKVSEHDAETIASLEKARNALMHGAILKEVESTLCKSGVELVDILGQIVFKSLIATFPKEIFKQKVCIGFPNTYIKRTLTAIAHIQTVVPKSGDGELDLDTLNKGFTFTIDRPKPKSDPKGAV